MKASRHPALVKWFLIGFGIRASLTIAITLWALVNFEAVMVYLADLPTMLFLDLLENSSPSLSLALTGSHPFYVPMNLVGSFLWGGIFLLIPLAHKTVSRLMTTPS